MDLRTGEPITAAQAWSGAYIWEVPNPLYFKILNHVNRPFTMNMDIITIRIQFNYNLRRALGVHKCFLTYRIWTTLHPQIGLFLRVFKTQVLKYLNNIGVISINSIIRAVNHVLWKKIEQTMYVDMDSEIKFNIY
ncbi:AC3 protein [Malvastrum yellow vein Yunnan virus]|uniref:Replication enhancer n=1 Tax=Malvastrum yellow vein Yunnan virus TaxID=290030 RepID=Q5K2L4_9GEMI|nr:AC3 protein [Malvastrum yellow vein Yunnan virus]QIH55925.1 replication enhancer protein [Malvastrum yellow vein Yunnan virus]QIH55984.1 replication enhancer protein [Malvastrum yellow vein Yunnan virus]QIH55991.1 replication enhancer protein [Malvastrum yellow vein Yunnan virus]QIH55998.1 replication enhancer protein [Malvastrum yellow vein Yunnan virus]CAH10916.1 AC3 protein [Malvastrum yellow vein Yunnan virus]